MALTVHCFCGHKYPYIAGECSQCHCRVGEHPRERDVRQHNEDEFKRRLAQRHLDERDLYDRLGAEDLAFDREVYGDDDAA